MFSLPAIPTMLVIAAAAALLVFAFSKSLFDLRGAPIYVFSTYALIVGCTAYARLVRKSSRWAAPFHLPLIPSLLIILAAAAQLIYVFNRDGKTWINYVAYFLSAYGLVLAITSYVRLFMSFQQTESRVTIGYGNRKVRSRFLSGLISGMLLPFFQTILTSFQYTLAKTAQGLQKNSIGIVLLAILSMIVMLIMFIVGPIVFLVGILCLSIWTQFVRGIILCTLGLMLMLLSSWLMTRVTKREQQELSRSFRG